MILLGLRETTLSSLKYGLKSIQTSLILRQRRPKPYKLLEFSMISVVLFKIGKLFDFYLNICQIVGSSYDDEILQLS